ncbi:MAG: hypothetical protein HGA45_29675 [Chloroflexales bacterium]|nr:hypothetical protein [Chloroflexales bacterium]
MNHEPLPHGAVAPLPAPLRRFAPALLALLILGGLYAWLATALSPGPRWLALGVAVIFSAVALVLRWRRWLYVLHLLTWGLLVLLTAAIMTAVALLLLEVTVRRPEAPSLLRDATVIWLANVLTFAWWYWALDGGGPSMRHHHGYRRMDVVFPQITLANRVAHAWQPGFLDYLFLAFTTSTAFSPTDTPVLSRRFKGLMMLQSLLSLMVTGVIIARAVNTL